MAGTDDDNTTLTWLLLGDTRERVIMYTHSPKEAEDLLLDALDQRAIRWRATRRLKILDPRWAWTLEAIDRYFWEKSDYSTLMIDWANHSAMRSGPVYVQLSEKGAQILTNGPRTVIEARLLHLRWDDTLRCLQSLDLAPRRRPAATAAVDPPPPASPPPSSASPTSSSPQPTPAPASMQPTQPSPPTDAAPSPAPTTDVPITVSSPQPVPSPTPASSQVPPEKDTSSTSDSMSTKEWVLRVIKGMPVPKRRDRVRGWKTELATLLQSKARRDPRLKEIPEVRYLKNLLSSEEVRDLLREK